MIYIENSSGTSKNTKDGLVPLANFHARITKQTTYNDGFSSHKVLTINATRMPSKEKLPEVEISAKDFPSMSWVTTHYGADAILFPGGNSRDEMRTAIMLYSKPEKLTIHTHTGWARLNEQAVYLSASGAINEAKLDKSVIVRLPAELTAYALPEPNHNGLAMSFQNFVGRMIPSLGWPLLAFTFRPIFGKTDFCMHLCGKTGTFKSEIVSCMVAHYGPEFTARNLPGSWSSTANALEAQAYRIKDGLFCIDDFIPTGTSWQVRQQQKTADQIIRAAGNQAGRARMTDTSSLQTTFYPRGGIISTGEDVPEGHSIRARLIILQTAPNDLLASDLTEMQKSRTIYAQGTAAIIQHLAKHTQLFTTFNTESQKLRDRYLDLGHSRTPSAVGQLLATLQIVINFTVEKKHLTKQQGEEMIKRATDAILETARDQEHYLKESDPAQTFLTTLQNMLSSHLVHLRTREGGIPDNAATYGWTTEQQVDGVPSFKSHGKVIGWTDKPNNRILLDANLAYDMIKRHSKGEITITRPTLFRRIKEANLLTEYDSARQRNTIRVTCQALTRNVLSISMAKITELTDSD